MAYLSKPVTQNNSYGHGEWFTCVLEINTVCTNTCLKSFG